MNEDPTNQHRDNSVGEYLKSPVFSSQRPRHPRRAFFLTPVFAAAFLIILIAVTEAWVGNVGYASILRLLMQLLFALPITSILIGIFMLLFVLPIYFLLRYQNIENAFVTIIPAGGVAGLFFVYLVLFPSDEGLIFSGSSHGCKIVIDNIRTACGWKHFQKDLFVFTCGGLLSGIVFWRLYAGRWVWKI